MLFCVIDLCSKLLEFIKAAKMPLTEQVFAALVTAYGVNGYVVHVHEDIIFINN